MKNAYSHDNYDVFIIFFQKVGDMKNPVIFILSKFTF